ncbi:DnaA-homolog protein hda [Oligella urethralis]|uniref:HdaA/DnaA family protein n=1 Tax=Oligella urethralis TaxID=90245 RepID=UPI000DFBF8CE|nr:DnaA/Hda family protein [Oligella urethralis]SUA54456.1 DnaA-homolog protein hda [Oligella urethralis]
MIEQLPLAVLPSQDFSFDNFVPGENWEALSRLMDCVPGSMLYLFGEPGSGKSHLLKALAAERAATIYFAAADFPTDLSTCLQSKPEIVAIDDVQDLDEAQQMTLFDLINYCQRHKNQPDAVSLIIAGDQAPLNMPIREDLRNRLGWGLAYRLHSLKDEDILLAIQQRAYEKDLKINKEATDWLLKNTERNIRSLFAWLDALDLYSIAKRRQVTLNLIKNFVQEAEFNHHL